MTTSNLPQTLAAFPTARENSFDPAPELAELRERQPVCPMSYPDGRRGWLVSNYTLAREVLADPRFSVQFYSFPIGDPEHNAAVGEAARAMPELSHGMMLKVEPPQHTRLRRPHAKHFTVRAVNEHRAVIERTVASCLDAMEHAGPPVDLVETFALPVPSIVTCELLGVPVAERERFEAPSRASQITCTADVRIASREEMVAYTREVIRRKRADPSDDLLSALIAEAELSDDELVGAAALLFEASHDTTATMLALGTFALLHDRARWDALRADMSLIPGAVEELLRYLTIFHVGAFTRSAPESVDLDGSEIPAGELVAVALSAANRDPEKFPDPDVLDIGRDARGHLAFGHGRHMCLGQHLARLELQIAFAALIERFPTLRLAEPSEDVLMRQYAFLYGPERLKVTW